MKHYGGGATCEAAEEDTLNVLRFEREADNGNVIAEKTKVR